MIEFTSKTIAERVVEAAYTGKEALFAESDTSPTYEFTPDGLKEYLEAKSSYSTFLSREDAAASIVADGVRFITVGKLDYFYDPNVNESYAALITADGKRWTPVGRPYLEHWGCLGDNLTDNYPMASKALLWAKNNRSTALYVGYGQFLTSGELVLDAPGMQIIGEGAGTTWDADVDTMATHFIGTSTTGSVFRVKWENCILRNFTVDASTARIAAPSNFDPVNYNGGIRFEADDVAAPEGDVFSFIIDNVNVRRQPNDGFLLVGRTYQGMASNFYAENNKGHGLCIDTGRRTGRTNATVAGVITLLNGYLKSNHGHGLAVGGPLDEEGLTATRVVAINVEAGWSAATAGIAYTQHAAYVRGDNHTFIGCAFSGVNRSGTAHSNGGVYVAGRNHRYINCRYLDPIVAATIENPPASTSTGIHFDGMSVRNSLQNYAIEIASGVQRTKLVIQDTAGGISSAYTGSVDPKEVEWTFGSSSYSPLLNKPLYHNPVSLAAHTGTTTETSRYSITIPANSMGPRGWIDVTLALSCTSSANNKTIRLKFGGTTFYTTVVTSDATLYKTFRIWNQGATNSQRTEAAATGTVDTTSDQTLQLTVELANTSETITTHLFTVNVRAGN